MSPEQLKQFEDMKMQIESLKRVRDIDFIKEVARQVFANAKTVDLPPIKLSDLSDVEDTDNGSTGQVLKKTATTWQPGTDNTGP